MRCSAVPRTGTQKEIKSAFRRLARQHHPDVNPNDPEATQRFKEINEANEVLSDPEKRRTYDQYGTDRPRQDPRQRTGRSDGAPFGQGPRVEYQTVSPEDLEDLFGSESPFSDFFHDLYGRSDPRGRSDFDRGRCAARTSRRRRPSPSKKRIEGR